MSHCPLVSQRFFSSRQWATTRSLILSKCWRSKKRALLFATTNHFCWLHGTWRTCDSCLARLTFSWSLDQRKPRSFMVSKPHNRQLNRFVTPELHSKSSSKHFKLIDDDHKNLSHSSVLLLCSKESSEWKNHCWSLSELPKFSSLKTFQHEAQSISKALVKLFLRSIRVFDHLLSTRIPRRPWMKLSARPSFPSCLNHTQVQINSAVLSVFSVFWVESFRSLHKEKSTSNASSVEKSVRFPLEQTSNQSTWKQAPLHALHRPKSPASRPFAHIWAKGYSPICVKHKELFTKRS